MKFNGSSGVQVRMPSNLQDLAAYTSLKFYIQNPEPRSRQRRQDGTEEGRFVLYLGSREVRWGCAGRRRAAGAHIGSINEGSCLDVSPSPFSCSLSVFLGNINRLWVQLSAWMGRTVRMGVLGWCSPGSIRESITWRSRLSQMPVCGPVFPCIQATGDYLGIVLKDRKVQWIYKLGNEEPASLTVDEDIGEQFATISINR